MKYVPSSGVGVSGFFCLNKQEIVPKGQAPSTITSAPVLADITNITAHPYPATTFISPLSHLRRALQPVKHRYGIPFGGFGVRGGGKCGVAFAATI